MPSDGATVHPASEIVLPFEAGAASLRYSEMFRSVDTRYIDLTDSKAGRLCDTRVPLLLDAESAGAVTDLRFNGRLFDSLLDFVETEVVPNLPGWHNSSALPSIQPFYPGYGQKSCQFFVVRALLEPAAWAAQGILGEVVHFGGRKSGSDDQDTGLTLSLAMDSNIEVFVDVNDVWDVEDETFFAMSDAAVDRPCLNLRFTPRCDMAHFSPSACPPSPHLSSVHPTSQAAESSSCPDASGASPQRRRQSASAPPALPSFTSQHGHPPSNQQPDFGIHDPKEKPLPFDLLPQREKCVVVVYQQIAVQLAMSKKRRPDAPFHVGMLVTLRHALFMLSIGSTLFVGRHGSDLAKSARVLAALFYLTARSAHKALSPIDPQSATLRELQAWFRELLPAGSDSPLRFDSRAPEGASSAKMGTPLLLSSSSSPCSTSPRPLLSSLPSPTPHLCSSIDSLSSSAAMAASSRHRSRASLAAPSPQRLTKALERADCIESVSSEDDLDGVVGIFRRMIDGKPACPADTPPQVTLVFDEWLGGGAVGDVYGDATGNPLMSWDLARQHRAACLDAVDALHKAGVYHGDLRPPNMILGDDGTVTIVDFNQSRADNPIQEIEKERLKFLHDLDHATDETADEGADEAA